VAATDVPFRWCRHLILPSVRKTQASTEYAGSVLTACRSMGVADTRRRHGAHNTCEVYCAMQHACGGGIPAPRRTEDTHVLSADIAQYVCRRPCLRTAPTMVAQSLALFTITRICAVRPSFPARLPFHIICAYM
jgi:hypothetical protein